MPPVFSVVGRSNTGKTTFVRSLIKELKRSGYRVAVIKHDPDDHGEVDKRGSDTELFFREGSDAVALSSPTRLTVFRKAEKDTPPEEIIALCGAVDCVILEGYKGKRYPKIEVRMREEDRLQLEREQLLAVVYSRGAGFDLAAAPGTGGAVQEEGQKKELRLEEGEDPPCFWNDELAEILGLLQRTVLADRGKEGGDD